MNKNYLQSHILQSVIYVQIAKSHILQSVIYVQIAKH